jgi:hypothetical protein
MPGETFEAITLDDVLMFMHEKMPAFNSVVVRAPGADTSYPIIPRMSVKNITIGQFLEFLKVSFPGVDIQRINGPQGPLYVVKVVAGPMDQPMFPGMGGGFGAGGFPGALPQAGAPQNVVQVYRLTDIVASLVANREGNARDSARAALSDILSLVQSALEESGDKEQVVLKVHEQTQAMLFKGSVMKRAVLEQVLSTLRPEQDPVQAQLTTELRDKVRVLEAQREIDMVRRDEASRSHEKELDEMRARLRATQDAIEKLQMENTQLSAQLEQARKSAVK